ncbi:MAG: type II toxin-antitoxin system HicB family antitoxin [Prevotellaceae bacterium]|jgi:predicted RNase H-like HicB family nuclease|nr:type II toxin-antitoxin system HicB family antitoxin [Prevotellaceae bacterium]
MKKIKVLIGWSGDNYSASVSGGAVNSCVIVTGKTVEQVKKELKEALDFHIAGCIEDGDVLETWLVQGDYEFEYSYTASALLHSLDGIVTRAAIARTTGINEKLIGHYAMGHRSPRPAQRQRIVDGIKKIGQELSAIE